MADFQRLLPTNSSSATLAKNTISNASCNDSVFGNLGEFSTPIIDYAKIFSSFHTRKSSSTIPVLHLPVIDGNEDEVDALSSAFDYSEVFGGFGADDFNASYEEELYAENHSENAWSPVKMRSQQQALADDFGVASEGCDGNLFDCSEKSEFLSNGTSHDVSSGISVSYNMTNKISNEDSVNPAAIHMDQFHKVAGITSVADACSPSQNIKYDKHPPHVTDDICSNLNSKRGIIEAEHFRETVLHIPVYSSNDLKADREQLGRKSTASEDSPASGQCHFHYFDSNLKSVGYRSYSPDAFLTVSNINFRTEPSQVPPPSRPPPKLVINQGDLDKIMSAKARAYPDDVPLCKPPITDQNYQSGIASETYAPEEASKDILPPYFDIEIDARSGAVASAASMKEAKETSQVRRRSIEESIDRKRDNLQDCAEVGGNYFKKGKPKGNGKISEENQKLLNVISLEAWEKEKIEVKDFPEDKKQKAMRAAHIAPDFEEEGELLELSKESIEKWKWNDFSTILVSHKLQERAGEWKTEKQLYELVKRKSFKAPENAPEWEIGENKMNATAKVHECEMTNKADEYIQQEENEKSSKHGENDEKIKVAKDSHKLQQNGNKLKAAQVTHERKGNKKLKQTCECEEEEKKQKAVDMAHQCEENENELEVAKKAYDQEENQKKLKAARITCEQEENIKNLNLAHNASLCQQNKKTSKAAKDAGEHTKTEKPLKAAEVAHKQDENRNKLNTAGEVSECKENQRKIKAAHESHGCEDKIKAVEEACKWEAIERELKVSKVASKQGQIEILKAAAEAHELGEAEKNIRETQVALERKENKNKFLEAKEIFCLLENGNKFEADQLDNVLKEKENVLRMALQVKTNQDTERKEKNIIGIHETGKRTNQERVKESEWTKKIGEKEREWEREKNMSPVQRATGEACDSAFVEAQERAERIVVEKVTNESQQKVKEEAQEKMGKAPMDAHGKSLAEKPSVEVRIGEEHVGIWEEIAVVDGATAESWNCAVEQALTENFDSEARERADRSVAVRCTISRDRQMKDDEKKGFVAVIAKADSGIRQIPSFSEFGHDPQIQSTDSSSSNIQKLSSSNNGASCSEKFQGSDRESARRYQARLERHQRTIERAAKALAEKKFRDILVQREQAERNRLAETLDADLRRWSNGKEGNLRALLSTLQYILGLESGWRPIPLTDVITAVGVKKAYRKAALCVHPDKVQQRGASIQQKYICEKVYDLLKEAWSKFNSEG